MSCHSSALSYAAVSEASMSEPELDDSQVQSIFHMLKREGSELDFPAPEPDEYETLISRMEWRARNNPQMRERTRNKVLTRLSEAYTNDLPDGATWYAIKHVQSAAGAAKLRVDEVLTQVSKELGSQPERLKELYNKWRLDNKDRYQDSPAPDPRFRYDEYTGVPTDKRSARALRKLGYEHYLAQPYPVFVYGTLRAGQRNAHIMGNAPTEIILGQVTGVGIYRTNIGFPYAAEHVDPDAITRGEIVWLSDDKEGYEARTSLDYLEGFDSDYSESSHYRRVLKNIATYNGEGEEVLVPAWMYLAQGPYAAQLEESDRIEHGDWVADMKRLFGRQ